MQYRSLLLALLVVGCGSSSSSSASPSGAAPAGGGAASPEAGTSTSADPKGITIGPNRIVQVRFIDAQNGFLLLAGDASDTQGVWATADGGASWAKRDIAILPGGIGFTKDLSRLWVVGTADPSNVWTSTDRGQTFAPFTWDQDSPGLVEFVDNDTIVVPDYLGYEIIRSTDGGASWTTKRFDDVDAAQHIQLLGTDVWLAGGSSFDQSGAQVTHSTDTGATWSVTNLTDNAHTYQGGELNAVHAITNQDVWVAGDSRQLFHTTDGSTWTQITGIPATFDRFGGIAIEGSRITIAGSSDDGYALYESTDSGASFHAAESIRCPSVCGKVMGIESPAPGVMLVYGDGLLWRVTR